MEDIFSTANDSEEADLEPVQASLKGDKRALETLTLRHAQRRQLLEIDRGSLLK